MESAKAVLCFAEFGKEKGRLASAPHATPAVDKALHLGGLGSVRVEPYPPLPKARPVEALNGLR
jgi:hypothetical protein